MNLCDFVGGLHRNNIVFRGCQPDPFEILHMARKCNEEEQRERMDILCQSKRLKDESRELEWRVKHYCLEGQVCMVLVVGDWKKDVRKDCPFTGSRWIGIRDEIKVFNENNKIMATLALQSEGHIVMHGKREAFDRDMKSIKILKDPLFLVQSLKKNQLRFQIASIL